MRTAPYDNTFYRQDDVSGQAHRHEAGSEDADSTADKVFQTQEVSWVATHAQHSFCSGCGHMINDSRPVAAYQLTHKVNVDDPSDYVSFSNAFCSANCILIHRLDSAKDQIMSRVDTSVFDLREDMTSSAVLTWVYNTVLKDVDSKCTVKVCRPENTLVDEYAERDHCMTIVVPEAQAMALSPQREVLDEFFLQPSTSAFVYTFKDDPTRKVSATIWASWKAIEDKISAKYREVKGQSEMLVHKAVIMQVGGDDYVLYALFDGLDTMAGKQERHNVTWYEAARAVSAESALTQQLILEPICAAIDLTCTVHRRPVVVGRADLWSTTECYSHECLREKHRRSGRRQAQSSCPECVAEAGRGEDKSIVIYSNLCTRFVETPPVGPQGDGAAVSQRRKLTPVFTIDDNEVKIFERVTPEQHSFPLPIVTHSQIIRDTVALKNSAIPMLITTGVNVVFDLQKPYPSSGKTKR
jgi:hypothetical protein